MKKQWQKPELIVVVRISSGEAVLQSCKTSVSNGPNATDVACLENLAGCGACLDMRNT